MNTTVPVEETLILESLDFTLKCGVKHADCTDTAEFAAVMRCCNTPNLICGPCLKTARERTDAQCPTRARCACCGTRFTMTSYDAVVRVDPL